jgi:hypothetical protein
MPCPISSAIWRGVMPAGYVLDLPSGKVILISIKKTFSVDKIGKGFYAVA